MIRAAAATSQRRRAISPSSVMTAERQLQLARVGERLRLGISEQQDRPLAVGEGRQRLGQRDRSASAERAFRTRRCSADMRLRRARPIARRAPTCCPTLRTSGRCCGRGPRHGAGWPTAARARASRAASRSAANTTQPISVGAMIGAATSWRGRPASTETPVNRPSSSGSHNAAASLLGDRRIDASRPGRRR